MVNVYYKKMCVLLIIISDLDHQAGYLVVQGLRPNTVQLRSLIYTFENKINV